MQLWEISCYNYIKFDIHNHCELVVYISEALRRYFPYF